MAFVTVSASTIVSVPLDFQGNLARIKKSIQLSKEAGATIRSGPELEICGYGCLDHHLESETSLFSIEVLADIISDPICKGMLLDLGLPIRHRNVRFNARAICTYRHIYFFRPKMSLAQGGLYREARHFTAWAKPRVTEVYSLEKILQEATGQKTVPIGDAILTSRDGITVSCESCEELFVPLNPSTYAGLNGSEIILNASASHAELRKLETRLGLITNAVRKLGGCYVYSNAIGVDGEARMMYDGSSLICLNGKVLGQSPQLSLRTVDVLTATFDIEEVRSHRSSISRNVQAATQAEFPRIEADLDLGRTASEIYLSEKLNLSGEIKLRLLDPMQEIHMAEAVWLWQYLTRTNSPGYFLSLSGGLDSSTVALFVYGMCKAVLESIEDGEEQTLADLRRVTGNKDFQPQSPKDIMKYLLHTCYQGTVNSSGETRERAAMLAHELGAYHSDIGIDVAVQAHEAIIANALDFTPRYAIEGGTHAENLAKQNVQARSRLVVQYSLAALSKISEGTIPVGGLAIPKEPVTQRNRRLVLETLTEIEYDASSADIAPLGSISKTDAKAFQEWARDQWSLPIMNDFINATPTAELLPLAAGVQDDESEQEMGLTYADLSVFGLLRKRDRLGPWSTYLRLLSMWTDQTPTQIAEKTMRFYRFYAINRHKTTIITPSVHLSQYDPDDNRHDLRPFLLVIQWPWQFKKIREHAKDLAQRMSQKPTHRP